MAEAKTEAISRAQDHVRSAIEELDDLTAGLHPSDLADGLAPALAALARRSPVEVDLTVTAYPLDAETALSVYFTCAEALSNAAKHAGAERVNVAVEVLGDRLFVTIADDGAGGADSGRGSGLVGLGDRWASLGGRLSVTGPPGGGTRLVAELPLGHRTAGAHPIRRHTGSP